MHPPCEDGDHTSAADPPAAPLSLFLGIRDNEWLYSGRFPDLMSAKQALLENYPTSEELTVFETVQGLGLGSSPKPITRSNYYFEVVPGEGSPTNQDSFLAIGFAFERDYGAVNLALFDNWKEDWKEDLDEFWSDTIPLYRDCKWMYQHDWGKDSMPPWQDGAIGCGIALEERRMFTMHDTQIWECEIPQHFLKTVSRYYPVFYHASRTGVHGIRSFKESSRPFLRSSYHHDAEAYFLRLEAASRRAALNHPALPPEIQAIVESYLPMVVRRDSQAHEEFLYRDLAQVCLRYHNLLHPARCEECNIWDCGQFYQLLALLHSTSLAPTSLPPFLPAATSVSIGCFPPVNDLPLEVVLISKVGNQLKNMKTLHFQGTARGPPRIANVLHVLLRPFESLESISTEDRDLGSVVEVLRLIRSLPRLRKLVLKRVTIRRTGPLRAIREATNPRGSLKEYEISDEEAMTANDKPTAAHTKWINQGPILLLNSLLTFGNTDIEAVDPLTKLVQVFVGQCSAWRVAQGLDMYGWGIGCSDFGGAALEFHTYGEYYKRHQMFSVSRYHSPQHLLQPLAAQIGFKIIFLTSFRPELEVNSLVFTKLLKELDKQHPPGYSLCLDFQDYELKDVDWISTRLSELMPRAHAAKLVSIANPSDAAEASASEAGEGHSENTSGGAGGELTEGGENAENGNIAVGERPVAKSAIG